MKLRHLRAFVAVADVGSFVGAARELKLAQAALSKQVAALESELGARLFIRGPREVVLTDSGAALIGEARRMVEMSELAVSRTRAAAD
ncbi:MAG TPA: LysR family transcriptional regulator, partial [Longimicrobium sp.]